jgi:hypothetical protein
MTESAGGQRPVIREVFPYLCVRDIRGGAAGLVAEDRVRAFGLAAGLVDVKVCAISEIWSGLKSVRRRRDR